MADGKESRRLVHGDDRAASRHLRDEGPGRAAGRLSESQRAASDGLRHASAARPHRRTRSLVDAAVREPRIRGALTKRERRRLAAAAAMTASSCERDGEAADEAAAKPARLAQRAARAGFGMTRPRASAAGTAATRSEAASAEEGRRPTASADAPPPRPRRDQVPRPARRQGTAEIRKIKARAALRSRRRVRPAPIAFAPGAAQAAARRGARTAKRAARASFAVKPVLGAVAGAVGAAVALGLACVLAVALIAAGGSSSESPSAGSPLPEAVEVWRGEATAACQAIFGDARWVDLVLAMMAQESGGSLSVLCWPGGVHRQDIMQACEGAFGSWIINGGGPHNLTACTPKASIWAGTAELKQNLDLWDGYLGGIEPHEVDKIKLVVQGYNFGARGWYSWNVRHGYTAYTLERAETYSATVMPAGAKGTPSHAEKVMRYYSWAAAPGGDGAATVARAYQELGKPYVWGAVGPDSYDCSGLVGYCLTGRHERICTTDTMRSWTRVVVPQPGDLTLNSHHTGVYIGNGQMIHAPRTGDVVKISAVHPDMWYVRY